MKIQTKVKKSISLMLSLLMLISMFTALPMTASAATTDASSTSRKSGAFEYQILEDGTAEITGYTGNDTELEIPDTIRNYTVTSIGLWAFEYCETLESVTIPDSVTRILDDAFEDCCNLKKVVLGNSVEYIGDYAFAWCESLEEITLPESVETIGYDAFYCCFSLESINIPKNVSYIDNSAFGLCSSLTEIDVDEENESYLSSDGVLYNKEQTELIQYPAGKEDESYVIPEGVTLIGRNAFRENIYLTSVTIPDSVEFIEWFAFSGCCNLESITIPDSVTELGCGVFEGCYSLTDVTIGNSVENISEEAFYACTSLTSVTIPDSVKSIEPNAFFDCTNLTDVTIPDGVRSIGYYAFSGCESLTSVTIPDSVESIGDEAFFDCRNLSSVTLGKSIVNIGDYALGYYVVYVEYDDYFEDYENYYEKIKDFAIEGYSYTGDEEISEAERYATENGFNFVSLGELEPITVDENDFYYDILEDDTAEITGYTGYLSNLKIPDTIDGYPVASIGYYAFSFSQYLKSVTIPEGVTYICEGAFQECYRLKAVTLPDSLDYIDDFAFAFCYNLTGVTIPDNVRSIGDGAFNSCNFMTNLTIGKNVVNIGSFAFSSCENLTSLTIPDSVRTIGEGAFYCCSELKSVTIGKGIKTIGEYALGYYFYYDEYDGFDFAKVDDFTIVGYGGTAAEKYANNNGFTFIDLENRPTEGTTETEPSKGDQTATNPTDSAVTKEPSESSGSASGSGAAFAKTTVTVKNAPKTLYVKGTAKINADVKDGKGATTYKSSNTKVAKVSASGKITALKKGTATITVTNNGVSKKFTIKVKNPKLNKSKKTLKKGKKFTLKITGGVGKAKFTSNNKKIATVNENGKITAKKKGKATITVKTNGVKLKCKITVK